MYGCCCSAAASCRRVAYEKGARTEKALESQAEIQDMQRERQALAKELKKKKKSAADAA